MRAIPRDMPASLCVIHITAMHSAVWGLIARAQHTALCYVGSEVHTLKISEYLYHASGSSNMKPYLQECKLH